MWKLKFLLNPCDADTCLVRASCHLAKKEPWTRSEKCPIYKRWRERDYKITSIKEALISFISTIIFLSVCALIALTFGLGLWKEWEYIFSFFN